MIALHILNLIAVVLLTLWPLWFSRMQLGLPWTNPFMIAMIMAFPFEAMKLIGGPLFLVEGGLFNPGYQFAILMTNVQLLCQWLGAMLFLELFRHLRLTRRWRDRGHPLDTRSMHVASLICVLLSVAAWVLLASAEFGIAAWIANPREGYQLHRTGAGHWFALSITFLAASMLFSFLTRPTAAAVLFKTPLFVALAFFTGSKGVMLSLFTTAMVFLAFLNWKPLPRFLGFGVPLIFAMLSYNLFLARGDLLTLQSVFEYFDYYKNAAMYYNDYLRGQTTYFWGEIAWTSYASYIPRAFWPDKPVVYGILLVNEIYYPGQAELTNTPAFGGAVEYFADFGLPAVAMSGLFSSISVLTALAGHVLFNNRQASVKHPTLPFIAVFTLQFVPTFGMFFPSALYGVLLAMLLAAFALYRRRIGGSRRAPAREVGVQVG
jgi:hypothetical protein